MCLIGWWLTAAAAHQGRRPLLMWQQDPLAPDANGSEVSISVVDLYLLWVRCSLHSFPVFLSFSGSCLNTNSCSGLLSSLVLMISCCRASSSRAELTMKIRHGTNPSLVKLKDSKSFVSHQFVTRQVWAACGGGRGQPGEAFAHRVASQVVSSVWSLYFENSFENSFKPRQQNKIKHISE